MSVSGELRNQLILSWIQREVDGVMFVYCTKDSDDLCGVVLHWTEYIATPIKDAFGGRREGGHPPLAIISPPPLKIWQAIC